MLTPNSIWNSFLNSDKRHIVLTGDRGAGKTTLLNKLFGGKLPCGITTYAIPKNGVYMHENGSDHKVTIGIYDDNIEHKNKMRPCTDAFKTFGVELVNKLAQSDSEWVCIDEIGFLEAECHEYCNAIHSLFDKKRVVAVVRKQSLDFLQSICNRKDVFLIDLDNPFGDISCVIMASGMGKRFGANKLMASFNGKPMIAGALDITDNLFDKRVVVTRHNDVARLCQERGVKYVLHDLPYRSDTIRLGINAVPQTDACIFVPGDQPLLTMDSIISLALASKNNRNNIWRMTYDGKNGMPVVFPQWALDCLLSLPQGEGGSFVIKQYPQLLKTIKAQNEFELMDVDTPEDLEFLQQQKLKARFRE